MATAPVNINRAGTLVARYARALMIAKGDPVAAYGYAEGQNGGYRDVALALKGAIDAGNTDAAGWSNELATPLALDFAEALRPATLLGRMQGFARVPFNCRLLSAASGTTATWRGEAKPMGVSKMDLDENSAIEWAGVGAIAVFTSELVRSATPGVDGTLSADIVRAVGLAMDEAFVNPENAGVAGVKPASITYGATEVPSTGTAIANVDADLEDCIEAIGNSDLSSAYWCISPRVAAHMSLMRGSGGAPAYPGINARGGSLLGVPVLTSNAVGQDANSPAETYIALVVASEVLLADDGAARIDYSSAASLQLLDVPADSAQAQVSLWQNNLVAVRAERAVNWRRRRATAVAYISGVGF
jgi:hypothetical protein